jgi:hypothetical protein
MRQAMSAPTTTRRNGNHGGDKRESDRLRDPFLRFIGKRANATVLSELNIPIGHGTAWLAGVTVLADRHQIVVRTALDKSGVEQSPCS